MFNVKCKEFDYKQIADSGQAFRMYDDGFCIAQDKCCKLTESSDNDNRIISFDCPDSDNDFWMNYFDLNTDYSHYLKAVDKSDAFLCAASDYGSGIRILRQDPWEMLITFIISQRKNIPAIKSSVEAICRRWGTDKGDYYAFPTAEELSCAGIDELRACSLGYRDEYIALASRFVCDNPDFLTSLEGKDYETVTANLLQLKGVGVKVANCVALFGYHKIEAFPVDVWIARVLDEYYKDGFPFGLYNGFAGVMQQYIFYYIRNMKK